MLLQADVGLVTLTGPGGVGKTTLALAAAHAAAGQFADGAAFISLETLTDPAMIRVTAARQLGIPTPPGQTVDESLVAFFGPRHLLLVVDNVEQLVSAAPLAEQILELAPGLKVLATSRGPLRLRGEKVVAVAPLGLPERDARVDLSTLAAVPAVAFFVACGHDAQPGFELTEANAAAVAEICRRLEVFAGGFTLEAVEGLVEDGPDDLDPLEAISSLVGQSVVFVQPLDETTPRYDMLETIREFALEQLEATGEAGETRRRHAGIYLGLAERAEPMLLVPAERGTWMAQLEHDHHNFRDALAWSVSPDGVFAVGVALAGALGWFWLTSGRFQEAGYWYAALIARQDEADDSVTWARMLHGSALQLWARGDLAQAAAREEPAVETFRSAGEGRWLAYGLALLAQIHTAQERAAEARVLLEEALGVWSQVTMTYGQPFDAYLRYYLGNAVLAQGDADSANAQFEASLREFRAADDDLPRGVVLGSLGLLAARRGEHDQARARFAEGLPLLRRGGDQWDLAVLLLNSGLEEALAASPTAGAMLIEALRAWQQLGSTAGVAFALAGLGEVAAGRGAPRRAGQLLGAGRALLPATDRLVRVIVPYDLSARLAAARAGGDPAEFDRGLADGQSWDIDSAVTTGLADP